MIDILYLIINVSDLISLSIVGSNKTTDMIFKSYCYFIILFSPILVYDVVPGLLLRYYQNFNYTERRINFYVSLYSINRVIMGLSAIAKFAKQETLF